MRPNNSNEATIIKLIACNQRLIETVEDGNKVAALEALKENAMLSIKLMRTFPDVERLDPDQSLLKFNESEFKQKLNDLLN